MHSFLFQFWSKLDGSRLRQPSKHSLASAIFRSALFLVKHRNIFEKNHVECTYFIKIKILYLLKHLIKRIKQCSFLSIIQNKIQNFFSAILEATSVVMAAVAIIHDCSKITIRTMAAIMTRYRHCDSSKAGFLTTAAVVDLRTSRSQCRKTNWERWQRHFRKKKALHNSLLSGMPCSYF